MSLVPKYHIPARKENGKRNVVIVGGGFGGYSAAKLLDKDYNVILVERNKLFYNCIAAVRVPLEPRLVETTFLSYDNLLKNGYVLIANVKEISPTCVLLDDDQSISFDYLIVATGTNNTSPFKAPHFTESFGVDQVPLYFQSICDAIRDSSSVLIVGGGSVGVEFAGEIREKYKDKRITLLHGGNRLVNNKMNEKFYAQVDRLVQSHNINVILNERLSTPQDIKDKLKDGVCHTYTVEKKIYTTDQGTQIEADLVFYCIGNSVNTSILATHFSNSLDENGRVIVNLSLQIQGHSNIFAIGDITNIPEFKEAYNAIYHSRVVCKNLPLLDKCNDFQPSPTLYQHVINPKPMIGISFGKTDGCVQFQNGWVFGAFLTKLLKSNNLLINRVAKDLNSPKPYFHLNNN
ncbi:hypothetical protein CYY_005443 [Polysphondylium violaceum]|uniref:FAD/NAD(P)-binding domain-containing protein n=1 Tax=Polysphondylium violaceum TaxID=133409 RepID=A0A8J4US67_9MYCE|nr:hypothetical protein CYY_005443 [Polysphondylium violaceum]